MGLLRGARRAMDTHHLLKGWANAAQRQLPLQLKILAAIKNRPIEWMFTRGPKTGTLIRGVATGENFPSGLGAGAARFAISPGDDVTASNGWTERRAHAVLTKKT